MKEDFFSPTLERCTWELVSRFGIQQRINEVSETGSDPKWIYTGSSGKKTVDPKKEEGFQYLLGNFPYRISMGQKYSNGEPVELEPFLFMNFGQGGNGADLVQSSSGQYDRRVHFYQNPSGIHMDTRNMIVYKNDPFKLSQRSFNEGGSALMDGLVEFLPQAIERPGIEEDDKEIVKRFFTSLARSYQEGALDPR